MTASPTPDPNVPETIWVRSDLTPDGEYRIGFSIGPDQAWTLSEKAAVRYAVACFAIATTAEHDAAVMSVLRDAEIPISAIGQLIGKDLRAARRAVGWPPGPLRFEPKLTMEGKPYLNSVLYGRTEGQLTPAELRDHATHVLGCIAAVNLDIHLHRVLVGKLDLDDGRARAFVGTLAEHWPPAVWPEPTGGPRG